ncbi:MotB family protein [Flexibacterium corallicola]|uniref:MotB family protein n=1 Tax=Flexibacterium corallicola TaxID=3037259 RepID=UPI00286F5EA9|nr:MotB family protein [Pseudovibrio sp. M1P-2-3]
MSKLESKELIIIRRRQNAFSEKPHGGVWKIAYADFATAMMAFFLVMWLISAADEKARSSMVRYFNPMRIVETAAQPKGLRDPLDESAPAKGDEGVTHGKPAGVGGSELTGPTQGGGTDKIAPLTENEELLEPRDRSQTKMTQKGDGRKRLISDDVEPSKYTEKELFDNPYAILAALIAEAEAKETTDGSPGIGGLGSLMPADTPVLFAAPNRDPKGEGLADGSSFRDPFDPQGWQNDPLPGNAPLLATIPALEEGGEGLKVSELTKQQLDLLQKAGDLARGGKTVTGVEFDGTSENPETAKFDASLFEKHADDVDVKKELIEANETFTVASILDTQESENGSSSDKFNGRTSQALSGTSDQKFSGKTSQREEEKPLLSEEERKKVLQQTQLENIERAIGNALEGVASGASIDFSSNSDGVVIQITDNEKFGMFNVGSAQPRPEIIVAMERIAKVLMAQEGEVVIRGHTDGRPFRSKNYDNWRLSTARAHMAYFMLVRGGLDEKRIVGIEGYADRRLKLHKDAFAPQNRRIEIMLLNGSDNNV